MRERKRVVIIGSGLGGLSCGVVLARNGYDVTILEQASQIGGCLQCFRRGGVKFETGMHFVGSAAEGQTLHQFMRYLELDKDVRLSPLNQDAYDIVSLGGKHYEFPIGKEAFIEKISGYFPHQRSNIVKYFETIERLAETSSVDAMKYAESDKDISPEYLLHSIDEVVEQIITDPLLAKVLVGNLPLYAAEKGKTPFIQHALIVDFYNQSAYRIVGGSDVISVSLAATIRRYGGEIRTRCKAVKILCDETHAVAVQIESGEKVDCDIVISDVHPKRTLELLDTNLIRPAFRKRIAAISETPGVFSLFLKFKKGVVPYMNSNFYYYEGNTPWNCEQYLENEWPKNYLYMHMCHEDSPTYAESGVVLAYMQQSELETWKDTTVEHRGAAYRQFKHNKAEHLLDVMEKEFPGLRSQIEDYYTATPLTYRDYTGTEDGGLYGIAKDVNKTADYRVSHRLRVPNVLQTGQNINSHGILGVLVGMVVTCSELLTAELIYQQIMEANK